MIVFELQLKKYHFLVRIYTFDNFQAILGMRLPESIISNVYNSNVSFKACLVFFVFITVQSQFIISGVSGVVNPRVW